MVNLGKRKPEYAPNLTIRVTKQTKAKLEKVAQQNNRSIRHEIEQRIQSSFEAEDLVSILLDDKSILAPLAAFAREYARILKIANIQRGSKLAIGLAGEVFRMMALSFVGGSMPLGFNRDVEHNKQIENDEIIAKDAHLALTYLIEDIDTADFSSELQMVEAATRKYLENISSTQKAPEVLQMSYRAIHTVMEVENSVQTSKNLREQMNWIKTHVLPLKSDSDNL